VRMGNEIRQNMQKPLTGKEEGLIGYWHFDDATAKDQTANNIHGIFKQGRQRDKPDSGKMFRTWWSFGDIGRIKTADNRRLKKAYKTLFSLTLQAFPEIFILNLT